MKHMDELLEYLQFCGTVHDGIVGGVAVLELGLVEEEGGGNAM